MRKRKRKVDVDRVVAQTERSREQIDVEARRLKQATTVAVRQYELRKV